MKNLHVIPTNKPSRLAFDIDEKFYLLSEEPVLFEHQNLVENKNIYITNSEEIKDVRPHKGKWQLETGQILNKFPNYLTDLSECKLVIMTTDQELIADGVQSIDDEFLEWFVKNPSCEGVEVKVELYPCLADGSEIIYSQSANLGGSEDRRNNINTYINQEHTDNINFIKAFDKKRYKIIIPKEENKTYNNLNYGGGFTEDDIKRLSERKTKQETLEEAAKKYAENEIKDRGDANDKLICSIDFINGAKWQQERMYEIMNAYVDNNMNESKIEKGQPTLQQHSIIVSWIDESIKPTTSECVAVMVDKFKYPTIGWYNRKFEEWVLEDRDVKGKVLRWFPLPNYR